MPYVMQIHSSEHEDIPEVGDTLTVIDVQEVIDGHWDWDEYVRVELAKSAADSIPDSAMLGCSSPDVAKLLLRLPDAVVLSTHEMPEYTLLSGETVQVRKYALIMGLGVSEDAKTIVVYQPKVE